MGSDSLKRFWRDESGATAIEYGLIAGLVAVAIIGAVTVLGGNVQGLFGTSNTGPAVTLSNATTKL